jgi:hypothetical protein
MFPFIAHQHAKTQQMPSFFQRKAPNINIEAAEIKTRQCKRCYTADAEIALKPYFSPTGACLIKLQAAHNIQIKTIYRMILKFSKKNNMAHLFRIGIIKIICHQSISSRLKVMNRFLSFHTAEKPVNPDLSGSRPPPGGLQP